MAAKEKKGGGIAVTNTGKSPIVMPDGTFLPPGASGVYPAADLVGDVVKGWLADGKLTEGTPDQIAARKPSASPASIAELSALRGENTALRAVIAAYEAVDVAAAVEGDAGREAVENAMASLADARAAAGL